MVVVFVSRFYARKEPAFSRRRSLCVGKKPEAGVRRIRLYKGVDSGVLQTYGANILRHP